MNPSYRRLSLFVYILLFAAPLSAQTEEDNLSKYCNYRQRFNHYFIYVGNQQGESMVARSRNPYFQPQLSFGQQGILFGYYLGMLATEYALLVRDSQDYQASKTLNELRYALLAYCEQMDKCEQYWNKERCLDGFFIRENIPLNFLDTTDEHGKKHFNALNKGLTLSNSWNQDSGRMEGLANGQPAWIERLYDVDEKKVPMSQDEAYGVMMGMALVAKCVPALAEEAKELVELITLHIIGKNACQQCQGEGYVIRQPDCESVSESTGGVTAFFGYGIAAAAAKVTGKDIAYFYNTFDATKFSSILHTYSQTGRLKITIGNNMLYMIWKICERGIPGDQEWNRSMVSTLAALGDSWGKQTGKGLIRNCYWQKGKKTHDWRSFYCSLWCFLHDKAPHTAEKKRIVSELNTAPYDGPYNLKTATHPTNYAQGGWAYCYRYRATHTEQVGESYETGIFNGLDYMLLYNLYQLIYGKEDTGIPLFIYGDEELSCPSIG
jgi:hypothetical protein